MKKIILLLVCALSINFCRSQCNIYYYAHSNPEPEGCSTPDSLFSDQGPGYTLNFKIDGQVLNGEDDLEATYNRVTGEFFDQNNDLILTLEEDGEVKDINGLLWCSVEEGALYDMNHDLLAFWEGDVDRYFVLYFMLFRIYRW